MGTDTRTATELLKEKVEAYGDLLGKVLEEPKMIAWIEAGPFEEDGARLYKVKTQGGTTLVVNCPSDLFYGSKIKDLKKGTEVMLIKGAIIAITPGQLIEIEATPEFDLVGWEDIGGLKSQLDSIREAVEFPLTHAELAKEMGLSPLKGILLYGPPGCGKTLIAKAIASSVLNSKKVDAAAFTYVKGGELLSMYVGGTEQRITNIFKRSREYTKKTGKRAVIFIDEAEAIMPARGSRRSSDVETTIVPTFLAEMDGFEGNTPFILLSTNLPGSIDPGILREGRIDLKVQISRPTHEDAIDIFGIHLKKVKCAEGIEDMSKEAATRLFTIDEAEERVSGAMIETMVKLSVQKAMGRKVRDSKTKTGVCATDLCEAINTL